MQISTKAALYNALLFPGWGQIYLKRYKRGILIIAGITTGIISMVWLIVETTINILRIAPFQKGTVTFTAVYQLTINAMKSINLTSFLFTICFILFLWILSIIDAYQLGKKEMTNSSTAVDQQSSSPQS